MNKWSKFTSLQHYTTLFICLSKTDDNEITHHHYNNNNYCLTAHAYVWNNWFLSKFAVKRILNIPSHLAYVVTLHCETLMSAKQANKNKLQSSVATYLRCGGAVNNQIKKDLLLSVFKKFLNRWIFGKITSKSVVVSWTLRAWPTHC